MTSKLLKTLAILWSISCWQRESRRSVSSLFSDKARIITSRSLPPDMRHKSPPRKTFPVSLNRSVLVQTVRVSCLEIVLFIRNVSKKKRYKICCAWATMRVCPSHLNVKELKLLVYLLSKSARMEFWNLMEYRLDVHWSFLTMIILFNVIFAP